MKNLRDNRITQYRDTKNKPDIFLLNITHADNFDRIGVTRSNWR